MNHHKLAYGHINFNPVSDRTRDILAVTEDNNRMITGLFTFPISSERVTKRQDEITQVHAITE